MNAQTLDGPDVRAAGPSPLLGSQLARCARALRGFFLLEGLARLVLAVAACAAAAVVLDYLLSFDAGTRSLALALVGLVALASAWRYLGAPLRLRLGREPLAEVLERLFPRLDGRLLAAVELERDASPEARRIAPQVGEAAGEALRSLDVRRLVRLRVLALEAAILGGAAVLVALSCATVRGRQLVSTGLVRLLTPGAEAPWPRRTRLEIEPPAALKVPQGETVPLRVRVTGVEPAEVWLLWRAESGARGRVRCQRTETDGAARLFTGEVPNALESFRVCARGGDGRSEFVHIEVAERPRIDRYAAHLTPPAYTGLAATDASGPQIRAHAGSRVTLTCEANKRLAEGTRLELVPAGGEPVEVPVRLAGRTLTAQLPPVEANAVGRLHLVDADGFTNADAGPYAPPAQFDLRCVPDASPVVELLAPRTDRKVAPGARVHVSAVATDDYGLARIVLRFTRSGKGTPEREIVLAEPAKGTRRQAARAQWDLTKLELSPGDRLAFYAAARDARGELFDPGEGRSGTLHIEVATPHEVEEAIYRWQVRLSQRAEELRAAQRAARARLEPARLLKEPTPEARGRLGGLVLEEDEILRRAESAREEFGRLVEEVYANRLTRPELELRLRLCGRTWRDLVESALPGAREALAAARDAKGEAYGKTVARAAELQDGALARIESIVGLLREWGDVEFILLRLRRTRDLQKGINAETKRAAGDMLGRALDTLSEAERARLGKIAASQAARRDETSIAIRDLQRLVDEVREGQAQFAARLLAILRYAQREDVVGRMHQCAGAIEKNRCASILETQGKALTALDRLTRRLEEALKPESYAMPEEEEEGEPVDVDSLMTQLEQAVRPLIEEERKILATVRTVDAARPREGVLPRALAIRLGAAARSQGAATAKTAELLAEVQKQRTVLFPLVLSDVLKDMREAGKLLGEARTGVRTQGVIEGIIAMLEDVISACAKEVIITEIKHVWEERVPGMPTAELVFIEDIRMLRLLQAGLNRKTAAFDRERAGAGHEALAEDQRARLKALGARQRQLAGLAGQIQGAAGLALEKMIEEKEAAKEDKEEYEERPDIEKALAKAAGAKLPKPLMDAVAKVILEEHESGRLVQKNQKVILDKLDASIRELISMVQLVSDMPDQPPAQPGAGGEPDFLKPPPDLTHLTGGPVGRREEIERRTDAAKAAAWGKLPPRLREAILQARGEVTRGRYAPLVRLYYRTLAGKKK